MSGSERRLFIAATSQNDGKTSCSIGLISGLRHYANTIGFMKPVGQRYVVVGNEQVDEDAVLVKNLCDSHGNLKDMNPVAVPKFFTREYLDSTDTPALHASLIRSIQDSYARIAQDTDLVVIEGTGHAGVGSVFDLSNAHVAKHLNAKVLIVTLGGIGKPADEIALNRCLFESEGVEVIGVIANKVIPQKLEQTREYLAKAMHNMGLQLFGVMPYAPRLTWPTMRQIAESLKADVIHAEENFDNVIAGVVVGAMTPHNALTFVQDKTLLIVPGDRDDLVLAAASLDVLREDINLAGILFTGGMLPQPQTLDLLSRTHIPALSVDGPTYEATTRIQKLTVKIQANDEEKIHIASDLMREYVDLEAIWKALE
ncbi:MAG TPA: AAA family ATPase [Armatimonadota bacterium]|nr:AAA family ATPase [Armatimonadota bacterium]